MKKIFTLLALTFFSIPGLYAQWSANTNKIWAFGERSGMDFTSGSPVSIATSIGTSEGCASVCDPTTGTLLFYTDGSTVYNNTGVAMPTGSTIVPYGTSSATQGALIVQVPGNVNQYYVFSLENVYGSTNYNHLDYCIVDMTLDGGLGDVVASTLRTRVDSLLGEGIRAVPGNSCNIWVVTHKKDSAVFLAYNINSTGFTATPVISHVGTFTGSNAYGLGVIKSTPDGTMLVQQCYQLSTAVGTELYDFNTSTGVVSNCRVLDSTHSQYGAEFSPDGTKLYAHQVDFSTGTSISQYDVSLVTGAAIRASRTVVASSTTDYYTDLKTGVDGKIYCITISGAGSSLDAFNTPNVAGTGCGYVSAAVPITHGSGTLGLPNLVVSVGAGTDSTMYHDTVACVPIGGHIEIYAHDTGTSYTWSTSGTADSLAITDTGTYWVRINFGTGACNGILDSITVHLPPADTTISTKDTTICPYVTSITFSAPTGFLGYLWDNASTGRTRTVTTTGTYWVSYHDSCRNVYIDTFHLHYYVPHTSIDPSVTDSMCVTLSPFTLNGPPGYTTYNWSTGSTASSIGATATGTYWVKSTSIPSCSILLDTFHVIFIPQPIVNIGNDTAFCVTNTITLYSPQPAGTTYLWSTGSTDTSIDVSTSGTYWLQVLNGYGKGCYVTDSIHVLVSPFPVVTLGPDTGNCAGTPIVLQSSTSYTAPAYLWSDGDATPTTTVVLTGQYWLQVTVAGCSAADSINVTIIYDTFTLYNNDTSICKGAAVQAFLTANPAATFQWVPTAGIAASTTSSPLIVPDTSAEYTVNIYIAGCNVKKDSFYIDVQPVPSVFIGNNRFVCQFDTLHLISSVSPAWYTHYSYLWQPGINLDDSTAPFVVFSPGDSEEIHLTVTTPKGCIGKDSALIMVHKGNFGNISTPDTVICPHETLKITASGGVLYNWSPGQYLEDSTSATGTITAITNEHYSVVITDQYGCRDTVYTSVSVSSGAAIYIPDSVTLYPGESYTITPQTNCTQFSWFPPSGLSDAHISDPVATPQISTKYIVSAATEWGCTATDSINIYVSNESLLAVPNAFTPGNGPNNKFYVLKRGIATLTYFRIFNRWGTKVFETTDIDDGWDGTYKGTPQPFDVYVYEIEAVTSTGSSFIKHGNVTLIR